MNAEENYYREELDDSTFDDACDLGQFFLNPCWFLIVKLQACVGRCRKRQHPSQQNRVMSDGRTDDNNKTSSSRSRSCIYLLRPLFILLLVAGWTVIFARVYPLAWKSHDVADIHCYTGYLILVACLVSWRHAATTPPGTITPDTMRKFDNYDYDNLLYKKENAYCPTLHQRKLPRSKYDRYTDTHVARFDHYCGWLQQAIGEENYFHFLIFVAVHAGMCLYGVILTWILLNETSTVEGGGGNDRTSADEYWLTTTMCLLSIASIPLVGLFLFHMYIITKGMTTNEYYKWKLVYVRHDKATKEYYRNYSEETTMDVNAVIQTAPPGPRPTNYYDCGIRANFLEVLYPRSLYYAARRRKRAV